MVFGISLENTGKPSKEIAGAMFKLFGEKGGGIARSRVGRSSKKGK